MGEIAIKKKYIFCKIITQTGAKRPLHIYLMELTMNNEYQYLKGESGECAKCYILLVKKGRLLRNFETVAPDKILCVDCANEMKTYLYNLWLNKK